MCTTVSSTQQRIVVHVARQIHNNNNIPIGTLAVCYRPLQDPKNDPAHQNPITRPRFYPLRPPTLYLSLHQYAQTSPWVRRWASI